VPRWRTLSAQLLLGQAVVLLVTAGVGLALWFQGVRHQIDTQYQQRALAIAAATAAMPEVRSALVRRDPSGIEQVAETVRVRTGAAYVVVIDRAGVRYSHPNPRLIGQPIEEPVIALDGRNHVGIDPGSLGRSANGKAPVLDSAGTPAGEVSAGVLEQTVTQEANNQLGSLAIYLAVALAVGLLIALLLARRLKKQTFGLEPSEIAALLQEREATLYGIREGVVAVDRAGRITLANDQAHHLLGTTPNDIGKRIQDFVRRDDPRFDVLCGEDERTGAVVLHAGRLLVYSRRTVRAGRRDLGIVVTIRDRTELEEALRELDATRSLTDALRAQQHEFANRMHVVGGLLELRHYDEAMRYVIEVDRSAAGLEAELAARIADPHLVALLVAKNTVARERGVALVVRCTRVVPARESCSDALVSIVGNLIDNAVDAALQPGTVDGDEPQVTVTLVASEHELVIEVTDTGPGVPSDAVDLIFTRGWSTKHRTGSTQRGLGLALVRQLVERLSGTVSVQPGRPAVFRVMLPLQTTSTEAVRP
jgi:two-component system CitB family sensor kinase